MQSLPGGEVAAVPSYKKTILGSKGVSASHHDAVAATLIAIFGADDDLEDGDGGIVCHDRGAGFDLEISDAVESKLAVVWQKSVVVKVLSQAVGYRYLSDRLAAMWKPTGKFKVIDMDHQFYLIQFKLQQDYDRALLEGPWMILGHYVVVQPWHPNFCPEEAEVTKVIAWIRLPGVPLHLYHKRFLHRIGDKIGRLVRIDYNTAK